MRLLNYGLDRILNWPRVFIYLLLVFFDLIYLVSLILVWVTSNLISRIFLHLFRFLFDFTVDLIF